MDRSSEMSDRWLGAADISPVTPVAAGSYGTWAITYTVGRYGIDDGGQLRIVRRYVSDWGTPQMSDPAAAEYCTVRTSGSARVTARWEPLAHVRPYQKSISLLIDTGYLEEGDTITVVIGDRSGGGIGSRAQTFCEPNFAFKVLVDCFGVGVFKEVSRECAFDVVAAEPSELVVLAASDVTVGRSFMVRVKLQDRWGNPNESGVGTVKLKGHGLRLGSGEWRRGVWHAEAMAEKAGFYRIEAAHVPSELSARSNPVRVVDTELYHRRFWGDLHGQSRETIGTRTADDYLAFARDLALVDFVGHQANDFQITEEIWETIRAAIRKYHQPGSFVTFLGYEWSGLSSAGGDRNVHFLNDEGDLHRSSHWQVEDLGDLSTDRYPLPELFKEFEGRDDVLLMPHVGGRYANMRFHDRRLEPLIEIYSTHGEFEWLYADALAAGCRVGIACGSDDHTGRLGASYPGGAGLGVRGGLLCVQAADLTREALWDAIRNRRCYGTTGERIWLDFDCAGTPIGGETHEPPRFHVTVSGTADIERIELRRGMTSVASRAAEGSTDRLRVRWSGARTRGRERGARWDGRLECTGTLILGAEPYSFDSPLEGLTEITESTVAWRSSTRGDTDGVLVRLSDWHSGQLAVTTRIASCQVDLATFEDPVVVKAGGLNLELVIEREPAGIGQDVDCDLEDPAPIAGVHPYHVMVLQKDGAKAWSSPIWVGRDDDR